MFLKTAIAVIVVATIVPAVYVTVPPGPPPAGPNHQFVDSGDGDNTCDQAMRWLEYRGIAVPLWHSQCDQTHSDPYNVPTHVKKSDGTLLYMGEGVKADNNYH